MSFDIQYEDGKEKVHATPQIIVMPKKESKISFSSESGHAYELRVLAERK